VIELGDAPEGADSLVRLPLNELKEARLVLTDELIRESLRRDAAAGTDTPAHSEEAAPARPRRNQKR
jgi:ribosome maturation factor RimP